MRRPLFAVIKVLAGLSLGLGLAELAFSWRDDGAFPHVNFYEPDDALATRLRPNASERISFSGNPVTSVRTNALGFRGADWPAHADVLVVGDSQVFGLGVEEHETFSARLAEQTQRTVLNAGVPTYGPGEYTTLVERVLSTHKVGTVIYVMNLSNDLFEVDRPNTTRHAVWDGWAVRKETAPTSVTAFPFRSWLMSQSHLVFAARKLLAGPIGADAAPSEGTWRDLAKAGAAVVIPPDADVETRKALEARAEASEALDQLDLELWDHFETNVFRSEKFRTEAAVLTKGDDPRDILERGNGEGAQPIHYVAVKLLRAALAMTRTEAALEKISQRAGDKELLAMLNQRRELRAALQAAPPQGEPTAPRDPLSQVLARTKAVCDAHGAKLFVIALPLDVMVSSDEWKKYGGTPIDMSASKVLIDDLLKKAELVGARGFDLTPSLVAAEPDAFLHGDLHLTPKGHAAVAMALAEELSRPDQPKGTLQLPPGRSWPPTEDEWRRQEECTVKGSTAAHCQTRLIAEYLRVDCGDWVPEREEEPRAYDRVTVLEGGHGDAATLEGSVVIPLLEGDEAKVAFSSDEATQVLNLSWPRGGARVMAFGPRTKNEAPALRGDFVQANSEAFHGMGDPLRVVGCEPPPVPDTETPRERAMRMVNLRKGDWLDGGVPAGAMRRCHLPCNADGGCEVGHCEPWPTGGFCATP